MNMDIVWVGTAASLVAGLATGFGALPVLFTKRVSDKFLDIMLGFAAE
jgi:ZIP family zinc transporter